MQRRLVLFAGMLAAGAACVIFGVGQRMQAARAAEWIGAEVNDMRYDVLLPAGYDAAIQYPVVLYLHQLAMGNYPDALLKQVNQWFGASDFRAQHPCIVVVPMLNQSADPGGRTINFGGKRDGHLGEDNALAALKQVMARYTTNKDRIYVTGNSMGGMGTWQMMLHYNQQNGDKGHIFAAGLPLAGRHGTANPEQAADTLRSVPLWAIHGADDREVSPAWDRTMARLLAGSATFRYTEIAGVGHDVWDSTYTRSDVWDWLFAQHGGES
jgi:predicted peptidase